MPNPACLAPALDDATLERYAAIVADLETGELKSEMESVLACVRAWWEIPESKRRDVETIRVWNPAAKAWGTVDLQPLEAKHVAELWEVTPWMRELESIGVNLIDALPQGDTRNALTHLLWFAKEITLDREPATADKLK